MKSLEEFVEAEIIRLKCFKKYWKEMQKSKAKEYYPDKLFEGEWLVQFNSFEMEDEK